MKTINRENHIKRVIVKLAIGKKEATLSQIAKNLLHFTKEWLESLGQAGISKPVSSVESIKLWSNFTMCTTILVVSFCDKFYIHSMTTNLNLKDMKPDFQNLEWH
jgi:hypothetical protein